METNFQRIVQRAIEKRMMPPKTYIAMTISCLSIALSAKAKERSASTSPRTFCHIGWT
ncbi:MAG: hypothetical protein HZA07_05040 [Nitrospirae bacterium]|nr:hypothetical protein [Nitrospirota bacterium]